MPQIRSGILFHSPELHSIVEFKICIRRTIMQLLLNSQFEPTGLADANPSRSWPTWLGTGRMQEIVPPSLSRTKLPFLSEGAKPDNGWEWKNPKTSKSDSEIRRKTQLLECCLPGWLAPSRVQTNLPFAAERQVCFSRNAWSALSGIYDNKI